MKHKQAAIIAVAVVSLSAQVFTAQARPITGAASIPYFGTPTQEVVDRVRPAAIASFKEDLIIWLKEEMRADIDTANTIKKFALHKLTERCLKDAAEKPSTRGRIWTLNITVSESSARSALSAHNDHYEKNSASQWDRHRLTMTSDTAAAFAASISALAAANARILPSNSGSRIGPTSIEDIRAKVQVLVDRMEVKANLAVIEGRPGSLPSKSPVATVAIAGKPISGFPVTVFAQNGRQLGRMVSDDKGELPLKNFKVPFVHNSSMMTISPDARGFLQANEFIRFRDMGIRFTKGQELTFIYKVPTLTYSLDYKVTAKDSDINIPQDFKSAVHIQKFLKDSCNLQPASSAAAADIDIKISVDFVKKTFEDTEEDALIMNAKADFRGSGIQLSDKTTYEQRYSYGVSTQMGEYIWESTRAVRRLIRGTLNKVDSGNDKQ